MMACERSFSRYFRNSRFRLSVRTPLAICSRACSNGVTVSRRRRFQLQDLIPARGAQRLGDVPDLHRFDHLSEVGRQVVEVDRTDQAGVGARGRLREVGGELFEAFAGERPRADRVGPRLRRLVGRDIDASRIGWCADEDLAQRDRRPAS